MAAGAAATERHALRRDHDRARGQSGPVDVDLTGRTRDPGAVGQGLPLPDRRRRAEGALYDDLGRPDAEPHLVRGAGFAADPQMYDTAIDGIADRTPEDGWPFPALDYAEAL